MILVMGLGYVGLTTAVGFAHKKNRVVGYDLDTNRVAKIKAGQMPFSEPGLDQALPVVLRKGYFSLASDLSLAIQQSKVIMICVGTPSTVRGVDLRYIYSAIEAVLVHVKGYKVIVIRSTVPPGTTGKEIKKFIEKREFKVGLDVGLVSNPEFLREGCAWRDFLEGERIVIGSCDKKAVSVLRGIYRGFPGEIFAVSLATAEFIKYLSNTLLATLISFSNEMATFAERLGEIDIRVAFKILHMDRRWSGMPAQMASYVYPGCGFGGACLPKDALAMLCRAEAGGQSMPLLKAVLDVNSHRPMVVLEEIRKRVKGNLARKKVTILGLSFKPHTDDVRHSPAQPIIKELLKSGAKVTVYDPVAMDNFRALGMAVTYANSFETAVKTAQYVVICTAWPEFRKVFGSLPENKIIDGRFMLRPETLRNRA